MYLVIYCLLHFAFINAQPREIVFTRITKQNGLASNRVNAVLKDRMGYYWISTINGLQRFDGLRMTTFQHNDADSSSLPNNELGFILSEDRQGRIWVHTESGLCFYQPYHRNFSKVDIKKKGEEAISINTFFQDKARRIWITITGDGLYWMDPATKRFTIYSKIWPVFSAKIISLSQDQQRGYFWLNTEKGLAVYNADKQEYYNRNNNPAKLQCLAEARLDNPLDFIYKDNNDILWLSYKNEKAGSVIHRYDIKNNSLTVIVNKGVVFGGLITDASGITWAYGNSLAYYDASKKAFVEVSRKRNNLHGIDFNEIQNMYEDGDNNIWMMTDMGLYTCNLARQKFTIHNISNPAGSKITDGGINGFVQTRDNTIIALSRNGGLFFFDSSFNQVANRYGYSIEKVKNADYLSSWCGLQDREGMIWIGCRNGRLLQLDTRTDSMNLINPPELEGNTVRSMLEDKNGNIWIGTQNNSIVKWSRSNNRFSQLVASGDKKYKPEWVLRIVQGYDNDLWITTTGAGLLHVDLVAAKIKEQFLPDSDSGHIGSYYIVDMIALNESTFAVATESGIDLFDWRKKTFSHITEKDGLPSTGVYSIAADMYNNIWFTSVEGVSKIHLPDKRIYNYGAGDGITSEDFQTEADYKYANVITLKNKRIAFGNPRGFVSFSPEMVNKAFVPADVTITGFSIFNRSLSVDSLFAKGQDIHLNYLQNYITVQFASLSNVLNNRLQYYYMLEGFDKEWKNGSGSQDAVYTYLPGGDYTFKVKCTANDGTESKNITSFRIYIDPPFYKTWWFYLSLLLLVSAAVYFLYRQRINKLLALEKLRTKVARDLHDDMGSTLSTINILSTMAKSKVGEDPVKASEYIGKISDNSQRMMEAMDDIVWSIRPSNDNMQKITARMREFATGILEPKEIGLDFSVDENVNDLKLHMEARRDFFLIFKEAINNLAKYSHCTRCAVRVSLHQQRLLLDITDNGTGFEPDKADTGNGLTNMQKRAEAVNGTISILSKPGQGTHILLNMPVQ